jgi:hypothetical protein
MPCQKRTFGHSRCARPVSTSDATIRAEGKGAAGIGTRIWHRGRAPGRSRRHRSRGRGAVFATVSCNKPPGRPHSAVSAAQGLQRVIRGHETPLSPGLALPGSNLCELDHFGESISFSYNE